jgi:uncharacterized RDD family membrane protein YckC
VASPLPTPSPSSSVDPFAPPSANLDARPARDARRYPLAQRGERFWANLLDALVLAPFVAIGVAIGSVLAKEGNLTGQAELGTEGILAIMVALPAQIYQWYAVSKRGQTLGKRLCRIRVVRLDGSPVDFLHAVVLRSWVPLGGIALLGGIGLEPVGRLLNLADVLSIFTASRRMLHDLVAGTKVVSSEPSEPIAAPELRA